MTISGKFKELAKEKRKALIVFLTAGVPDMDFTADFIPALQESGADIVEIGVPFSDPIADGPVIQKASQLSIENGTTLDGIFTLCGRLKGVVEIPYLLMSYYNPVYHYGLDEFAGACVETGISGAIIPDLSFEESTGFRRTLKSRGIDLISFVSSTTSAARRKAILKKSTGFIYYIAVSGVTGAREILPEGLCGKVGELVSESRLPVAVGFGISNGKQVRELGGCADGVIIGSLVMSEVMAGNADRLKETLKSFREILDETSDSRSEKC